MANEIIPSHQVASWLLDNIKHTLDVIGLSHDKVFEEIIYVSVIVGTALLVGWLVRRAILWGARKYVQMRDSYAAKLMLKQKVLTKCSHIIPPLVILALLPFAFDSTSKLLHVFEKCLFIYTTIVTAIGINAVLTYVWTRFDERENTKNLPLKGILNIAVGIVWAIVVIVGVSIIVDKSPAMLLTGLGVLASALLLVFKDTILGFVAGIQLSENDMLHVGDWIVVPSTIANGIVEDVSLTAVKVRNWDNTIVTMPPYTLISTSFQNWRGMSSSGWRQICRAVIFDAYYIKKCDDAFLDNIAKLYPQMASFIDSSRQRGKPEYDPGLATVNGTIETNLGLFRAYMCQYLLNHPLIGNDRQILVRVMVPTGVGIPLQLWCFTTTAWTAYEAVQSEIFEHIAAVCPDFGLQLFNYPSGTDTEIVEMHTPDRSAGSAPAPGTDSPAPPAV